MKKRNLRLKETTLGLGEDAEKRILDLESANQSLKRTVEELRLKLAHVSISSSVGTVTQSCREFSHKSIATKLEGMSSRGKSNLHSLCSTKKHRSESPVNQFDCQVQKLKAQKVKLQCKIKLDSMQFRLSKASLEKETLQLRKELRKSEFEKHVLSALNKRQKMILQLKNTQALTALRRLKLLLQSKKISSKKNNGQPKGTSPKIQESSNEVGLLMKLNKIHSDYERQMKEIAEEVKRFSLEASVLKAEFEGEQNSCSESCDNIINHTPMDSELKELKEEFNKLSTLVSQMEMTKSQLSETNNGEPAEYSVSSKDTDDQSNLEPSQPDISEETVCNTNNQLNLEPSEPKTSEETLCNTNDESNLDLSQPKTIEETRCKKEQSKAEVCCSCTKKSSCKTKNCKCRANGSGCGSSCGCLVSKCSNREEMQRVDGVKLVETSNDDKEAKKQPLRDIGNIREAGNVGKQRKMLKPVTKK
ncbi:hypothetical protein AALP_AA6G345800 [Arabis alpina]|uniref:Tesmin/TSO1-like CXC domain-containing protein n=1 Tax=Arabis alpina TaxID=50452 RepID=A0A087GTL6_ARAAL|nr:hypothetical protein AALP_AA6G345800 [Arabis alpina]